MKTIIFHSPPDGDIIENPTLKILRALVLFVGEDYWNSGSGEALIEFSSETLKSSLVMYFNQNNGFYLHYLNNGNDLHSKGNGRNLELINTYIGGNLKILPSIFYINVEKAYDIIQYFYETGHIKDENDWISDKLVEWDWDKYLI